MARFVLSFVLLPIFSLLFHGHAQDNPVPPQLMQTANPPYGPDGPWQAVSVQLGNPPQFLDLYPGGSFESWILTKEYCSGTTEPSCGRGGLFVSTNSTTLDNSSIREQPSEADFTGGALAMENSSYQSIRDDLAINGVSVPNISAVALHGAWAILPNNSTYPHQLGMLALGGPSVNQSFGFAVGPKGSSESVLPPINASLVSGYLQAKNYIPSSSYGLHIGSAALNLPLSLWFGGYDSSRVIGQVMSRSYPPQGSVPFIADLADIGIGVDSGSSPFGYSTQSGLLAKGNDTIKSFISVNVNPRAPYMNLPNSTCAAIAKELPLTYSSTYGLWLWDTEDPQYAKIVTSPTYLRFTFSDSTNPSINVPFQLLNLTLEPPITPQPTQYFPCQPPQNSSTYILGRAFLQAAFIGVNWQSNQGRWFLAQAPGPNVLKPQQVSILSTDDTIKAGPSNWTNTWSHYWTPLSAAPSSGPAHNTTPNSTQTPTHYLGPGADAGVSVGAVGAVLVGLAMGFVFVRRKRRHTPQPASLPHRKGNKSMTEAPQGHSELRGDTLPTYEMVPLELAATEK